MRIISGKFRSKFIKAPTNLPVRPTTDFAKEGLFNVLNNRFYLEGISVLDLFSGTGNISYEFASRGAGSITAVDQNSRCVSFISRMSRELDADIISIEANAMDFVKRCKQKFDIIFMDPPYDFVNYESLIDMIIENRLLTDKGELIVEHDKAKDLSQLSSFRSTRNYGKVGFSFFEYI